MEEKYSGREADFKNSKYENDRSLKGRESVGKKSSRKNPDSKKTGRKNDGTGTTGMTVGRNTAGIARGNSDRNVDKYSAKNIGKVVGKDAGRNAGKNIGSTAGKGKEGRGRTVLNSVDRRRALSICPVFEKCGGCQLLHLPYDKQLELKKKRLEELLTGICPVKQMIGMENPYHYRNKVHAVFDHDKKGNPLSGVYQEGTHILVPIESCMIEDEKADEIIGTIRGMLRSFKIKTYDEDTGYGFLRHVLVKRGFATGEIMVVLVTASPVFPSKNNFVKALREKHPEITTIVQNMNDRVTSMVLGDRENVLFGKGFIEDELCGYRFRISSKSFYQVNPVQAKILYEKAIEMAKLTGRETVLDAYCGVGTIGMVASKQAGQVIGVELNQDAVKDAVQNAKQNGIKNIQFYCNDAGRFITAMADRGEKVDVVLMDPPRSGSTKEFIDAVVAMGPGSVVYVSCGPETLARDLRMFMGNGYRVVECVGVDMFGGTKHVETVILMTKCGFDKK